MRHIRPGLVACLEIEASNLAAFSKYLREEKQLQCVFDDVNTAVTYAHDWWLNSSSWRRDRVVIDELLTRTPGFASSAEEALAKLCTRSTLGEIVGLGTDVITLLRDRAVVEMLRQYAINIPRLTSLLFLRRLSPVFGYLRIQHELLALVKLSCGDPRIGTHWLISRTPDQGKEFWKLNGRAIGQEMERLVVHHDLLNYAVMFFHHPRVVALGLSDNTMTLEDRRLGPFASELIEIQDFQSLLKHVKFHISQSYTQLMVVMRSVGMTLTPEREADVARLNRHMKDWVLND